MNTYEVPSEAMEPTVMVGDRILVNRTGIGGFDVGDIVVFHPPAGADRGNQCGVKHDPRQSCPRPTPQESSQEFLKRIVAGPGDTVAIKDGHPIVNGVEKKNESYLTPCQGLGDCNLQKPITVPPDHYFMLGDNRGASDDSRFWGPVPSGWIVGVVVARYLPLDHIAFF